MFTTFEGRSAATDKKNLTIFPFAYRNHIDEIAGDRELTVRAVADLVSGLTERQAMTLHRRLTGISLGSVVDRVELT